MHPKWGGSDLLSSSLHAWLDMAVHEAMLFAAIGFIIGGVDDLAVDAVYFARALRRWLCRASDRRLADLPPPRLSFAILIPAWSEEAVIGAMLRSTLARWPGPDVCLYVGTYPNDLPTRAVVEGIAQDDARVRLCINPRPGPTTKADNLNHCWHALLADERANGMRFDAIVLHDAEDVVHPGELAVYADALSRHDAVQLPVMPLPDPDSRYVAGCYIDEFAEAHQRVMVVRQALGAALPFAGTGCAMRRTMIARVAAARGGDPFDADSLTEDYELGLTIAALGGSTGFARVMEADGRTPVAVRAYFPGRFDAAIRQKARWMVGIALAGWDRVGWSRPLALAEHWMRMRDRRAPLAVLVLFAAYLAFAMWAISYVAHAVTGTTAEPLPAALAAMLHVNAALLGWRTLMRVAFVTRVEGWREGARAIPRLVVSNLIAMAAVQRALVRYVLMLRGGATQWEKTAHQFPAGPDR